MKKVIITEEANRNLIKRILREADYSAKVDIVKKFLDKNFARGAYSKKNDDGTLQDSDIVVQLDSRHQPTKTILTDVQLFYIVQNKFKNILSDKKERDGFLKRVIKDWYAHKISKNGSLSKYDF